MVEIGALDNITWEACSYTLQFDLSDTLASFSDRVAALLEKNIRTLVYYGDKDLVCTWNGGLQWTWVMEWTGMVCAGFASIVHGY
jgi:carboxypeptidase C (cathepsin A)